MRRFLKVAIEIAECADSGRLSLREGEQEQTALALALVLILGAGRVIPLLDPSERDGSGGASMK